MDFVRNEGVQGGRHLRRRLTCDNGPVLPTRRARLLIGPGIVPADASMADVSGVRARSSMSNAAISGGYALCSYQCLDLPRAGAYSMTYLPSGAPDHGQPARGQVLFQTDALHLFRI